MNTRKPSEGCILDLSSYNAGKVTFDNVRANYLSGRGGAIYYDPQTIRAFGWADTPDPSGLPAGYCYFNTDEGKPLWLKYTDSVTQWVDGTGEVVLNPLDAATEPAL